MLETLATVFVLGMMAAFAICAVLVNEGAHAGRRRDSCSPPRGDPLDLLTEQDAGGAGAAGDDRRLPVGDFLFGALFLRGSEPLAFSVLADAAAGSGMNVAQVLSWIDRAEEAGLVERVTDDAAGRPAVRLTETGMELARNDRRRERATERGPATRDRALSG